MAIRRRPACTITAGSACPFFGIEQPRIERLGDVPDVDQRERATTSSAPGSHRDSGAGAPSLPANCTRGIGDHPHRPPQGLRPEPVARPCQRHLERRLVHAPDVLAGDHRQVGPDRRRWSVDRRLLAVARRRGHEPDVAGRVARLHREVDRLLPADRDLDASASPCLDADRPLGRERHLDRPGLARVVPHRHRHLQRLAEREDARQRGQERPADRAPGSGVTDEPKRSPVDRHRHDPQRPLELRHLEGRPWRCPPRPPSPGRTRRRPARSGGSPPSARTGSSPPPPRRRPASGP